MGLYHGFELENVSLGTEDILLRAWTSADAAAVFAALEAPSMRRYLGATPDPYTEADAVEWVERGAHTLAQTGTGLGFAITSAATGTVLGAAALRLPAAVGGTADIGYWIAPNAQGHGYASTATRLLTEWALGHGVARIEVRCHPTNLASARTALSAGMAFESYRRNGIPHRDGPEDAAVFVRIRNDSGSVIAPRFHSLPTGGLSDGVITLQVTMPDDLPGILEIETDPRTVEVSFTGTPQSEAELSQMVARAALDWQVGSVARMTVFDVVSRAVAGTIQLRLAGPPNVAGIGYAVHPAFRGRGITARALALLSPWALADGGFARLELGAKRDNIASQRAALSGGFEADGVRAARLRNPDGSFSDEVRFALVAPHLRP
jgi:RimJ/RimL family protein N-acetyltransferase